MLVANGASSAERNVLFSGMWSAGNGPPPARLVKFKAVITVTHARLAAVMGLIWWERKRTIQNDNFVCRVNIKAVSEGKRDGVVIQRRVCGRIVCCNWRLSQPCDKLLDVPNP